MKILKMLMVCVVLSGTLFSQNTTPSLPKKETLKDRFVALLEKHPDQAAVAQLRKDLTGSPAAVPLTVIPGPASYGLPPEATPGMQWFVSFFSSAFTARVGGVIAVQESLFTESTCRTQATVEALGLAYANLEDFSKKFIAFSTRMLTLNSQGALDAQMEVAVKQEMVQLFTEVFPLISANTPQFSKLLFSTCTQKEIQALFGTEYPTDNTDVWTAAVQKIFSAEGDALEGYEKILNPKR